MSYLQTSFVFLNNSSTVFDYIIDVISVLVVLVGSSCFLAAFIPKFLRIYRTQNTSDLNKKEAGLNYAVGACFFVGTFYLIVIGGQNKDGALIVNGATFTFLNFISSTGFLYIIAKKGENTRNANKLGISEKDYYEQHVLPTLNK